MQHVTCSMQHVTCSMQHATCIIGTTTTCGMQFYSTSPGTLCDIRASRCTRGAACHARMRAAVPAVTALTPARPQRMRADAATGQAPPAKGCQPALPSIEYSEYPLLLLKSCKPNRRLPRQRHASDRICNGCRR
jgi:hypothetical protein